MIENSWKAPIKIFFSVPSCVHATSFDYSGAEINSDHIEELLQNYSFVSLSEMMNISGVLQKDAEVWRKLKLAEKCSGDNRGSFETICKCRYFY